MTLAERLRDRLPEGMAARLPGGPPPEPPPPPLPEPVSGAAVSPYGLGERRERLARDLAERQWDLGGIAYEMAIRDHFRLDVIVRRAADLQRIDAELGEVERLLHLERAGAAGFCQRCDALHSRGAGFCWRCGLELLPAEVPHDVAAASAGDDDPAPVESNGSGHADELDGLGTAPARRDQERGRPGGRAGPTDAPTGILEAGGGPEPDAGRPEPGRERFRREEENPGR